MENIHVTLLDFNQGNIFLQKRLQFNFNDYKITLEALNCL